jgi:hypothetical protein
VLVAPLIIGLLVGGRFYADLTAWHFWLLAATPLLLLPASLAIPGRRDWVRGAASLLLVAIAVAAIAGPVALEAMRAAEHPDPNSADAYR